MNGGAEWVNVARLADTKYFCLCKSALLDCARSPTIPANFATSRVPAFSSTRSYRSNPALLWSSLFPCPLNAAADPRFLFAPAQKLFAPPNSPANFRRSSLSPRRLIASTLSVPSQLTQHKGFPRFCISFSRKSSQTARRSWSLAVHSIVEFFLSERFREQSQTNSSFRSDRHVGTARSRRDLLSSSEFRIPDGRDWSTRSIRVDDAGPSGRLRGGVAGL